MGELQTKQTSRMSTLYSEFTAGRKRKRVGRGPGSGMGKTATRGQKGAGARSGFSMGNRREGLRILMQQKPKFGFTSRKNLVTAKLPLSALSALDPKVAKDGVTLDVLKNAGLITKSIRHARVFLSGKVDFPISFGDDVKATRGVLEVVGGVKKKAEKSSDKSEG